MSEIKDDVSGLKTLGAKVTEYKDRVSPEVLETFPNAFPGNWYQVEFETQEISSLCVTGDTLIDVARDESKYPEGIAIKDLVGKDGFVFSFDTNTATPVVKRFFDVRKTRENVEVLKINLEKIKGRGIKKKKESIELKLTPEHPVLVKRGFSAYVWIMAKDLKIGDRLISDQKFEENIRGKARHRLIMEALLKRPLKKDELIHHKDGNHFNNTPDNLEIHSNGGHFSLHQKNRYGYDDLLNIETLVEEYNSGENCNTLSKKYNCDRGTIKDRLKNNTPLRTQRESLLIKSESPQLRMIMEECRELYEKGYTIYELEPYYDVHSTTILKWIRKAGGIIREANYSRKFRKEKELPSLNHKVLSVEHGGYEDVYNMEVADTECYFANEVVVHNCPKTRQPDFGTIVIRYIPMEKCIESKSLKLYLFSYRNEPTFMESLTNRILNDLVACCSPRTMEVEGRFNARGGIYTKVIASYIKEVSNECCH